MKVDEIGIFQHMDMISPEAYRAQRMAELQQLANYRARKLKRYQEWSDPEKRALIQNQARADEEEAKHFYASLEHEPQHVVFKQLDELMKIRPLIKPQPPKKKWYQWIRELFSKS